MRRHGSASSIGFFPAILILAASGSSAQEIPAPGVRVDTLPNGRIVISNPDSISRGPAPSLVEELRVGSLDDDCSAFGDVYSLAVDDAGRIYAADAQTNEIRMFSREGECLRMFGGAGDGPGEFAMLAGIAWREPGYVWGLDALRNRLTVFDTLGVALETHSLGRSMGASLPWPMWVDEGGGLHIWNPGERRIDRYAPGSGLTAVDAFPIPEVEREYYASTFREAGLRMSARSPIPHSPDIEFTVDRDGEVWLANEATFDLHEITYAGDTLRTVTLRRPAPRLEGRERDSLAVATGLDEARLPQRKPALEEIDVGADGWIWVDTGERPIRAWEVFDPQGIYRGKLVSPVPIEPEPFPIFGAGTITAVTKGALDVQYVVRLRVVR
ncbi:MAG: 6-bladed beta-propeller [Gemmatimonadetes bacterium]|nr:6-bladed beta-propeller [Candidatus Palauibacter australiensis]